ncbi:transposase is4 [Holotrichia oblita]|uniref:Transposase is4 n=1 Tax=Holotrichia oblita TaxID=644536 RepID=A0ACB9SLM6_HOLOL|nr:transposase is4 [Holotrichia oblita]
MNSRTKKILQRAKQLLDVPNDISGVMLANPMLEIATNMDNNASDSFSSIIEDAEIIIEYIPEHNPTELNCDIFQPVTDSIVFTQMNKKNIEEVNPVNLTQEEELNNTQNVITEVSENAEVENKENNEQETADIMKNRQAKKCVRKILRNPEKWKSNIRKKLCQAEQLMSIIESEDFWQEFNAQSLDVFITPPEEGNVSEEDSDDEDSGEMDHLSGRQLQAQATATIHTHSERIRWNENSDESEYDDEDEIPLAQLHAPDNPVSCFELFIDEEVCNFLVDMFIKYAKSKGDHAFTMDVGDLKCYIAILLLSGYIRLPRWRMLWESKTETYNEVVAKAMRRNRFEQIKKYTHCADNDNLLPNDKFAKLRPLINMMNSRFFTYSQLTEHLSIDESMIPYYGRHSAKQFIRGKPIRYGYKMWSLCEPQGYLIQFHPYQGKEHRNHTDLGVGGSVVMNLLSKLPKNIPFKIYADRFFSSLRLVKKLKEIGYGYTGTVMANRIEKCPILLGKAMEKKERGTYDYLTDTNTNTTVTSWNDNRVVLTVKESRLTDTENQEVKRHFKEKDDMRKEKENDKKSGIPVLCFDLENVITCLKSFVGNHFYLPKLSMYNLTAHLSTTNKAYCALWIESLQGRSGNCIASAFKKL